MYFSLNKKVRLATLDVLDAFSKKIGDMYNSYLSETVPFLAELMEGKQHRHYSYFVLINLFVYLFN